MVVSTIKFQSSRGTHKLLKCFLYFNKNIPDALYNKKDTLLFECVDVKIPISER